MIPLLSGSWPCRNFRFNLMLKHPMIALRISISARALSPAVLTTRVFIDCGAEYLESTDYDNSPHGSVKFSI